jgi:hypothetical protein
MKWHVRAETTGELTLEQQEALADGADVFLLTYNSTDRRVALTLGVEAADPAAALAAAKRALARQSALNELAAAGVLEPAHRITVESEDAPRPDAPVVSTKGFAALLDVSEQRVRVLTGSLGFPEPLNIPGAAGMFFRRDEAEAYAANRKPAPAGRPRAGDEELLNDGLRLLAEHAPDLTPAQRHQVEQAIAGEGGRYVRGKAKVLAELSRRPKGSPDPWRAMAGPDSERYVAAVARADEIWRA